MPMLTEENARERWCPEARVMHDIRNASSNRNYLGRPDAECIGSDCMAWRYEKNNPSRAGQFRRGWCGKYSEPRE